jgi:hypothetical protein
MRTVPAKMRIAIALAAAGLATGAQAQSYRVPYAQPPLYPYAAAPRQPYAVEVSPGVYVIQRPAPPRAYPYVREQALPKDSATTDRPRAPADRALIEELVKRNGAKQREPVQEIVVNSRRVVRDAPVVRETTRIVDDPPRVIERRHVVEDAAVLPPPKRRAQAAIAEAEKAPSVDDGKARVIRAEAEITILGPDRMSIRLFRKRHGAAGEPEAKAQPGE